MLLADVPGAFLLASDAHRSREHEQHTRCQDDDPYQDIDNFGSHRCPLLIVVIVAIAVDFVLEALHALLRSV